MVDLDSNPTKLIEIVEVGKQLLITRGALTTFSIANDVAKYFAILPAMFAFTYAAQPGERGPLNSLNIMHLGHAAERDHLGDHLQRADHPRPRPARAQGREVPRDRRHGAPAPQPADLRARRDDPAVHRDQADRPRRPQPPRGLSGARPLPDPARDGRRGGEDLPDARRRGGRRTRRGRRRRDRLPRAARPARRRRRSRTGSSRAAPAHARTARPSSRRWTSTRSSAAAPELALVDELAHTNLPEARNRKRYEDIDEILDAGIDVTSTVNIQHLESLNDEVFELTGVRVRETFPDRILDEADEVVLVDLAPEALQERLRAGKVYPAARVDDGARRTSSGSRTSPRCASSSLRELAEDVEARRHDDGARPAQPAGGRRADPRARHARAALAARCSGARSARGSGSARRSTRSGCGSPGQELTEQEAVSLAALRRLASILGAHFIELEGDNLAERREAVRRASAARPTSSSARPTSRGGREILRGSLVSKLVRELPGIDIRVVADRALREEPSGDAHGRRSSSRLRRARGGARRRRARRRRAPTAAHAGAARILVPFTGGALDPTVLAAGDPDRARRGRDARPGVPDRRAARAAGGRADAAAGDDGDAAARGGRARRAPRRCAGRRADRERPHAGPRAASGSGRPSTSTGSSIPAPAGRATGGFTPEGPDLDAHARAERDADPPARSGAPASTDG